MTCYSSFIKKHKKIIEYVIKKLKKERLQKKNT